MTHEVITLKFVVPTVLAIALGFVISIVVVHTTSEYPVPVGQPEANHSTSGSGGFAEWPNPHGRLSRVHLLLSR